MERSCERALEIGLPAIAFTEHADWALVHKGQHPVDIGGDPNPGERRPARFPQPRLLTRVALGGAPPFPKETPENLAARPPHPGPRAVHNLQLDGGILAARHLPRP